MKKTLNRIIVLINFKKDSNVFEQKLGSYFNEIGILKTENYSQAKEMIDIALEEAREEEKQKNDLIKIWKEKIAQIAIAWFVLSVADDFTSRHLFMKYIALLVAGFITWNTIISVALQTQKVSFAHALIREFNKNINFENKFCFFNLQGKFLYDENGMTKHYKSVTLQELRQMYTTLIFLILVFVVDFINEFIHVF